jgi:hypothetical protein
MPLSEYTDQAILNSLFGQTSNFGALASAPTIYVGLSSTTPNPDGTGVTEPSGGGYARVSAPSTSWGAATLANPSVIQNSATLTFPTATASWAGGANLTYVVLFNASTAGTVLGYGALTTAKPVLSGDTASFAASALQVTLA